MTTNVALPFLFPTGALCLLRAAKDACKFSNFKFLVLLVHDFMLFYCLCWNRKSIHYCKTSDGQIADLPLEEWESVKK